MTTITDDEVRRMLGTAVPYTVGLLRWGPNRHMDGVEANIWEHVRRMALLRAEGVMSITCPIGDEALVGVGISRLVPERLSEVLDDDPCVRAGVFVYEVHAGRSFPGDALPA